MKALHIIQRYEPAPLTGSEKAMVILCEALAAHRNHTIQVATSDVEKGEGFYDPRVRRYSIHKETINGVVVVRLPVNWLQSSILYIARQLGLQGPELAMKSFGPILVDLEKIILAEKPDILHVAPMPMRQVYDSWQIAKRHDIPFVVTPTMHFEDPMFDNPLIYTILKEASGIIAHTLYEKTELTARGIKDDKIAVIPSSYLAASDFKVVDKELFRKKYQLDQNPIVLFIGSKSVDKGTVTLLDTWPKVREKVPNATLVLAGVSTASWQAAKVGKDFTGVVELDYINESTKQELFAACNVFAIPSKAESFGMVLLEAWAKGKPVIGGSAGATREMISEGKDGYTVDFGDENDLTIKIVELLTDLKKQQTFGEAGIKKAKGFTKDLLVKRTFALYEKVLNKK